MEIANCTRCGKVFARHFRDICQNCYAEIENEYSTCAEYLREHRGATITELSEETGVSIRQITKFVKEGRISMVDAPNLSYPCESCGVLIREGNICGNCRNRLMTDLNSAAADIGTRSQNAHANRTYKIDRP